MVEVFLTLREHLPRGRVPQPHGRGREIAHGVSGIRFMNAEMLFAPSQLLRHTEIPG